MIEGYVEKVINAILKDEIDKNIIMEKFMHKFENVSKDMDNDERWKAACRIVGKKMVRDNLALRKKTVGEFLKTIRTISQQSFSVDAFEDGSHSVSSEPYFRDMSYKDPAMKEVLIIDQEKKILKTEQRSIIDENEYSLDRIAIAVDSDGKCYLHLDDDKLSKSWKCNLTCKTFCSEDIQSIIDLKNEFSDESVETAREVLQLLDNGCEHGHYNKPYDIDKEESSFDLSQLEDMKGHPLPCSSGCCSSWLRMLRAGAVHYPVLRPLLNNIYRARRSDNDIREIESSLSEGSICSLKNKLQLQDLSELLDDEDLSTTKSESLPTSESHLEVKFAGIIKEFYEKLKEDPEFTCCS